MIDRIFVAAAALGLLLGCGTAAAQTIAAPAEAASSAAPAPIKPLSPIPFAAPDAANVRVPSAPDAWGGPRTAADETLSDRVVSYNIEATLDPEAHIVTGHQLMTWRNRSNRPVSTVYLHMYLNAFAGPGSTLMTERRVDFGSGNSRGTAELEDGQWGHITLDEVTQHGQPIEQRWVHPDNGPETDRTVLALDLAQPVPAHGTLTLNMRFTSKLPRVVIRTGWWGKFHLVAQWFPKIAVLELPGERGATEVRWNAHEFHFHSEFYADYASFDVKLTVPEGYVVGAVGKEIGQPVKAGGMVTHHFVQHDVIDFAWMAAPGFKVLDTTWTGPGSPEVAVRVLYPPEYEAVARPVQQATLDSLTYFSETLGPYPYETVTAVVPPYNAGEAGGMEYPTFFTASGGTEYMPGTMSEFMIDFVTIHEFGHGYFMGILGSNEFEEPMLDEGLNEYWDQRMLTARGQKIYPISAALKDFVPVPGIDPFVFERMSGVGMIDFPADSLDANAWDRLSNSSYGSVYSRTAAMIRTIENIVGVEAMGRAMKLYYERWKFRHPSAADFEAALAEGTGHPQLIHAMFASQVYSAGGRVDASVVSIKNFEQTPKSGTFLADGKRVIVTEDDVKDEIKAARKAWEDEHPDAEHGGPYPWHSVVTVRRTGPALPTGIRVNFADDSHVIVEWDDDSRWKRFSFDRPVKVVSAVVDPENKILLDVNMLNNSRVVESDETPNRRYAGDWSAIMATVMALLGSL